MVIMLPVEAKGTFKSSGWKFLGTSKPKGPFLLRITGALTTKSCDCRKFSNLSNMSPEFLPIYNNNNNLGTVIINKLVENNPILQANLGNKIPYRHSLISINGCHLHSTHYCI